MRASAKASLNACMLLYYLGLLCQQCEAFTPSSWDSHVLNGAMPPDQLKRVGLFFIEILATAPTLSDNTLTRSPELAPWAESIRPLAASLLRSLLDKPMRDGALPDDLKISEQPLSLFLNDPTIVSYCNMLHTTHGHRSENLEHDEGTAASAASIKTRTEAVVASMEGSKVVAQLRSHPKLFPTEPLAPLPTAHTDAVRQHVPHVHPRRLQQVIPGRSECRFESFLASVALPCARNNTIDRGAFCSSACHEAMFVWNEQCGQLSAVYQ
eukprot:SAG31_NODE_11585_length_1015_cov_2.853712_1_plen_267_part_01